MKNLKYFKHGWGFFSEPFELFLALAAILSGVVYFLGKSQPNALEARLPHWELILWILTFTLSGVIIMASRGMIAVARTERALELGCRVEAVGMTLFGTAALLYSMVIFSFGLQAFVSGVIIAAWGGASFVRLYIIMMEWKPYRDARKKYAREDRSC